MRTGVVTFKFLNPANIVRTALTSAGQFAVPDKRWRRAIDKFDSSANHIWAAERTRALGQPGVGRHRGDSCRGLAASEAMNLAWMIRTLHPLPHKPPRALALTRAPTTSLKLSPI